MTVLTSIRRVFLRWQQRLLSIFVKTKIIGPDLNEFNLDLNKPIIYALRYPSHAEQLLVDQKVSRLGWGSPVEQRLQKTLAAKPFINLYQRAGAPFRKKGSPIVDKHLVSHAQWLLEQPDADVQIVPVRVFWGREPNKERSFLRIWLQNSGALGGRLVTLMAILLNGRNTFVHFSKPIPLKELSADTPTGEMLARKAARVLRVHNRHVSASVLGPDLSHRRTLVHTLPNKPLVLKAIESEPTDKRTAKQKALKYADEIASNISYTNVRFLDVLLTWVWNKLYNGINIHNIEPLKEISKDNEIIYVPCHRSHIDYLLLSYVLYHHGLQLPQIAAGINLNMPIVGAILRRGGAFFMRRSFRDNKLYAAVFDEYLHSMFTHGYAAEYFVEGGRSRTGRTLSPKAGMLAMTLRSYLRDSRKPIIFIPVYTGYEKVFEANSYLGELRGQSKKKESLLGILSTLKSFKHSFGKVGVTFGNPIYLNDFLQDQQPNWREADYEHCQYRPDWAPEVVNSLAHQVVTEINRAASVNPINLIALGILSAPRQAMDEHLLIEQMESYKTLLERNPYSELTALPKGNGKEWLQYGEQLQVINRSQHPMGDLIQTDDRQAVTLTYYRNNVLHLFALPSLLSCLFINNQRYSLEQVKDIIQKLYPFLQAELFLHWQTDELDQAIASWLNTLHELGYLMLNEKGYHSIPANDPKHVLLEGLAENVMQTLQRYYLTLVVLERSGSGTLTAQTTEEQCTLLAQRMSLLYGINSPEFFDKNLFRTLIQQLLQQDLIMEQEEGKLSFGQPLQTLAETISEVLQGQLKQSILRSIDCHNQEA